MAIREDQPLIEGGGLNFEWQPNVPFDDTNDDPADGDAVDEQQDLDHDDHQTNDDFPVEATIANVDHDDEDEQGEPGINRRLAAGAALPVWLASSDG